MGFFDTLGKKATEAYNVTTKKTGELAKEAKLRMKINENKSNINDLYKEIGKKVYEKHLPKGLIRKAGSGRYTRHLEFRAFRGKLQARKEDDTIVNFANAKP